MLIHFTILAQSISLYFIDRSFLVYVHQTSDSQALTRVQGTSTLFSRSSTLFSRSFTLILWWLESSTRLRYCHKKKKCIWSAWIIIIQLFTTYYFVSSKAKCVEFILSFSYAACISSSLGISIHSATFLPIETIDINKEKKRKKEWNYERKRATSAPANTGTSNSGHIILTYLQYDRNKKINMTNCAYDLYWKWTIHFCHKNGMHATLTKQINE